MNWTAENHINSIQTFSNTTFRTYLQHRSQCLRDGFDERKNLRGFIDVQIANGIHEILLI